MKSKTLKLGLISLASASILSIVANADELKPIVSNSINFITNTKITDKDDVIKAKDTINNLNLSLDEKDSFKDSIKFNRPEEDTYNIVKNAKDKSEKNTKSENETANKLLVTYNTNKTEDNYNKAKNYINSIYDTSEKNTLYSNLEDSHNQELKRIAEETRKKEEEKQKELELKKEQERKELKFDSNGLLVEEESANSNKVAALLLAIPGHRLGFTEHTVIDPIIDQLSAAEAVHVIHKIEGAGFGQTADGLAGVDSPQTHRAFVDRQVNGRKEFNHSIFQLLKLWGTFRYDGY